MANESAKVCSDCRGEMVPIVVMDKVHPMAAAMALEYRVPDDKPGFWSNKFPTAGAVESMMCASCGRIQMYGKSG